MNDYTTKTDAFIASLGVEAYRVGGSVRDEILGRRVKDADYMVRGVSMPTMIAGMVSAGARKVSNLKDRQGRHLGIRAVVPGGAVEITLPRKEISTGPGHHDFDIVLDPTLPLHEDAKRRDFTFNALYKAVSEDGTGIVADPTNTGLYDLEHRLVRTTYPTSFRDDPLRTLRALRFVSVLGYDLTAETLEQMRAHAAAVNGLTHKGREADDTAKPAVMSGTVLDEMSKLLMGPDCAKALRIAAETGVLGTLFPELAAMIGFEQGSKYHDMTTDEHTFTALETAAKVDAPLRVRWGLLFHDSGKPATAWIGEDGRKHYYQRKEDDPAKNGYLDPYDGHVTMDHAEYSEILWREAAERMNVPAKLREDVARLVRNHMMPVSGKIKGSKVRRDRVKFGDDLLRDLYLHRMCDLCGKGKPHRGQLAHVAGLETLRVEAKANNIPASTKDLAINGRDCIERGLTGREIGRTLAQVLDEVVTQPNDTKLTREWQLERLNDH